MTQDEEDIMIGQFTQEAWKHWVKAGWLDGLQKEFGQLSPKELVIFEDGWKMGFGHSATLARDIRDHLAKNN